MKVHIVLEHAINDLVDRYDEIKKIIDETNTKKRKKLFEDFFFKCSLEQKDAVVHSVYYTRKYAKNKKKKVEEHDPKHGYVSLLQKEVVQDSRHYSYDELFKTCKEAGLI